MTSRQRTEKRRSLRAGKKRKAYVKRRNKTNNLKKNAR